MKSRKRGFSEIHKGYKEFKRKDTALLSLYNQVKREYIDNKELDITLEKIYLENKLKGSKSDTFDYYLKFFITSITIVITVIIERTMPNSIGVIYVYMILLSLLFFILLFINKKPIRFEIDEYVYYSVCLEVIKEIEKMKE